MPRFQFRLQTVLKLREADRRQRRLELAQAYHAERLLEEQIDRLAAEEDEMRRRCQVAAGPGRVDVNQLLDVHRYVLVLKARSQLLLDQRARLQKEIERRRLALVEADREVRVLEKLRERQLEQHRETESRQQVRQIDEVAQRSARRVKS
jgi:flagellar FliJ protein